MTDERVERILNDLRPADADFLRARLGLPAWERRRIRLDRRDALLRDIAARYHAGRSARVAADAIVRRLQRIGAVGLALVDAADPERAALVRVVQLAGGDVPSPAQVRRILAGERTPIGGA